MPYPPQDLDAALTDVRENHASMRAASIKFQVPYTTLRSRLKGTQTRRESHKHTQLLSPVQEEHVAQWILKEHAPGTTPTHDQIKKFAEDVLALQQPSHKRGEPKPKPKVGKRWIKRFMERNPVVCQAIRTKRPLKDSANSDSRNTTPPLSPPQHPNEPPEVYFITPKCSADLRRMRRLVASLRDGERERAEQLMWQKIDQAFDVYAVRLAASRRESRIPAARIATLKAAKKREKALRNKSDGESGKAVGKCITCAW